MPPCPCDPSKEFFIIRFVDGSEEELSDEERVQTNQDKLDEFEENRIFDEPCSVVAQTQTLPELEEIYTKNEDLLKPEMLSKPERGKDENVGLHLSLRQKRQNARRRQVREMQRLDSPQLSERNENEEQQKDTVNKAERQENGYGYQKREAAMFDVVAKPYIPSDLVKQQNREKANFINHETSQYLSQRLAKLRDLEPKRTEQKTNAENEPMKEMQAQQQATTHAVLVKSHADLIERQEQERQASLLRNKQINTTMSQYLRARLELELSRRSS